MSYSLIPSDDPTMDGAKVYRRKIADGEKLGEIAKQYGRNEDELQALNKIPDKDLIRAGHDIDILLNKTKTDGVEDEFIKLSQEDTNGDGYVERYENALRYIDNKNNNTKGPKLEQESEFIWGKTEKATFTSDGSLTYKELSENLGVSLDKLLPNSSVTADTTIPKGAKIGISDEDLPEVPVMAGVTQSTFGTKLYIDLPDDMVKDTSGMSKGEIREYKKQLAGVVASYGDIAEGYNVNDLKLDSGRIVLPQDKNILGYY